jgi:hypothetical protein
MLFIVGLSGICYKNRAIPIMFKMLNKRGNSETSERIQLIQQFVNCFGKDRIDCLLAHREFVEHHWLDYLNKIRLGITFDHA